MHTVYWECYPNNFQFNIQFYLTAPDCIALGQLVQEHGQVSLELDSPPAPARFCYSNPTQLPPHVHAAMSHCYHPILTALPGNGDDQGLLPGAVWGCSCWGLCGRKQRAVSLQCQSLPSPIHAGREKDSTAPDLLASHLPTWVIVKVPLHRTLQQQNTAGGVHLLMIPQLEPSASLFCHLWRLSDFLKNVGACCISLSSEQFLTPHTHYIF